MLSTSAFNALLKTLEEPPAHVKFIFATTEIRKVPVTVLSRCQRFDLRRIEPEAMLAHLAGIAAARRAPTVAPDALALIARAAEGSVRDALSLLDQAIAHGARRDRRRPRCAPCSASPTAAGCSTSSSTVMGGDAAGALAELARAVRRGRRSAGGAARPRRGHPLGLDGQDRARGRRRPDDRPRRARPRPRLRRRGSGCGR